MIEKKMLRNITIILLLTMPLFCVSFSSTAPEHSVWIVKTDGSDDATDLAIRTLLYELDSTKSDIRETTLSGLESVPLQVDVLIVVGHGQPHGLEVSDNIISWSELYDALAERQPQKTIVLACNSPSDPDSNVFGFGERIDAEAGALIASWLINQEFTEQDDMTFPYKRVVQAQSNMDHPLGRYLYFVHGYWGINTNFERMANDFDAHDSFKLDYDPENVRYFSYFDFYDATNESMKDSVHWGYSISHFAHNFYVELLSIPEGSQINIIAHSMGGLIVREMLRLYRSDLDSEGLFIGKVITLGTPHDGTLLANPLILWSQIVSLIGGYLIPPGHLWPSPVFWSMDIFSPFIDALNQNPSTYSEGIDWYTISGFDYVPSALVLYIHFDMSDPIVATGRAHLSFATNTSYFDVGHQVLVDDSNGVTYNTVLEWITDGEDSDNDGLTDDSEIYFHETDPYDSDSDNDGLGDYEEIVDYKTNPTESDSDSDNIPDGWEVSNGLDPLVNDASQDPDDDGLTNLGEYQNGTDPHNPSSDSDDMLDGWEVFHGLDPLTNDAPGDPDADGLINLGEYQYGTDPNNSDSDNDGLNDYYEIFVHNTDPNDSDTDDDTLSDYAEIYTHGTYPTYWSSDGDILSDAQEIAWGYDPHDPDDPIPADNLIYLSKDIKGMTGYVRANHYAAMDYVKVYVRYKTSSGYWTSYSYVGLDSTPYYSGDYYVSWSIPPGYVQMKVKVNAYDSSDHYLGSDITYVTLPDDGGGGPLPD